MAKAAMEPISVNATTAECHMDISLLTKHIPLKVVRSILKKAGRESVRQRSLPAQVMIYYVIAMTIFMEASLREVVRLLFPPTTRTGRKQPPVSSAITQARQRLGFLPLELLFNEVAKPIATEKTRGAWYNGLRLVAIDGSTMSVADTPENEQVLGRPKASKGMMTFPKIHFIALAEVGTRILFAAQMGGSLGNAEMKLAMEVVSKLRQGMLCLADRYYASYPFWKKATESGAELLIRARVNLILPPHEILPDGSYLSVLYPSTKDREHGTCGIPIRVIGYRLPVVNDEEPFYRLITALLDHTKAPAVELAALYTERWQVESAYDELKTHLRGGAQVVLRSKTPDLVRQEFFGMMLAYFSIRAIMHETAVTVDEDLDRLSFIHAVRVIKRSLPQMAAFSPRRRRELHDAIIMEIAQERVSLRRMRMNHRGIKRKSRYPIADRSQDRELIMPPCNFIQVLKPQMEPLRDSPLK